MLYYYDLGAVGGGGSISGGGGAEGGGYWSIQLSPNSISSVPFRDRHISVWEHAAVPGRYGRKLKMMNFKKKKLGKRLLLATTARYYAMPLVELRSETAHTYHNILLGQHEMEFEVLMWSEDARAAVFRHLREEGRNGSNGQGDDMLSTS